MSSSEFLSHEQVSAMQTRELLFRGISEAGQQQVLQAVIAECTNVSGELEHQLSGDMTQAFLGSVHPLIRMGAHKIRNNNGDRRVEIDDLIQNFYARRNVGKLALNLRDAEVAVSTRITGESHSVSGHYADAHGVNGVRFPTNSNSRTIIHRLNDAAGDDFARSSHVADVVDSYGGDHIDTAMVQAIEQFRRTEPVSIELVTDEQVAEQRMLIEADMNDDELVGSSHSITDRTDDGGFEVIEDRLVAEQIVSSFPMQLLNEVELCVIMRRAEGLTFKEIGQEMGFSSQRASQIKEGASPKLVSPHEVFQEAKDKPISDFYARYVLYFSGYDTELKTPQPKDLEDLPVVFSKGLFRENPARTREAIVEVFDSLGYVGQAVLSLMLGSVTGEKLQSKGIEKFLGRKANSTIKHVCAKIEENLSLEGRLG